MRYILSSINFDVKLSGFSQVLIQYMNFISFKVYMYYIQCCVCFSDESDLDDDDYLGDQRSSLYNHTGSHYSRSPRSLSSSSTQDSGHSPRPIQINGASKYMFICKDVLLFKEGESCCEIR